MKTDIIFGNKNLELAKKLGFEEVITLDSEVVLSNISNLKIVHGTIIEAKNKQDVINQIRKSKGVTLVMARDDEFNRFVIERTRASGLINVEYTHEKDHIHFRRSGLDQVICSLAAKNKKVIVTSITSLLKLRNRSIILGRIAQNISFCKKYKVNYIIASFAKDNLEMKCTSDIDSLKKSLSQK